MAAATVGGALLSASIQVIFDRLASPQVLHFLRATKLDPNLLSRLHTTLYAANALLDDAEHKQIKYPTVKNWLHDLQHAVYLTEDLMDQLATQAVCNRKEVTNSLLFSNYFNFHDREVVKKIDNIVNLLESIMRYQVVLGLKEGLGEKENFSWKIPSSSLVEGSAVFGRDEDKEAIVSFLLSETSSSNKKDCFVMHHLIHDLAKFVAGEFCLASEADNVQRIPQRTRHLSYDALNYPVFKDFMMFCEAKHLRTFLPIYSDNYGVLPLHERVPHLIFAKLRCLRVLSLSGYETTVSELGELQNLGKSLAISRLENTENVLGVKMKDKKCLEHLEFSWSSQYRSSIPLGFETKILHNLQPQMNLKSLSIRGYPGSEFPVWIGHNGYHNMVSLSLHCCDCSWLPPLGQLPSLKHLLIHGFRETCIIGPEFFGTNVISSIVPFASLETLVFSELDNLLSLQTEPHSFQRLRELEIRKCASLVEDLPNNLPALKKLVIIGCNKLVSSLPTSPMVQEIEIHQSENIVLEELPVSLHSLRVSGSNLVDSVFISMMQSENCLEHLDISDCVSTISISGWCLPSSLRTLEFKNCKNFEVMLQSHMALESYKMKNSCGLVESFPVDTFPALKCLHIEGCENLASLLVAGGTLEHLDSIAIIQCPKLVSLHEFELYAPRLRSLTISRCENLKCLPNQMQRLLPTLTELSICDCPEIESFPEMGLPSSLSSLVISNCLKLTALRMLWNLPSLTSLTISGIYQIIESFPEEGLLPDTLTFLSIEKVLMLQLDCKQLQYLTSLKYLWIVNCPMLESMTEARTFGLRLLTFATYALEINGYHEEFHYPQDYLSLKRY
ncbi:hypothetical protein VNO77_25655 [Canavalia gladiata]|uniref:Rx N-terminal domain-containing protein n=1 Tax=Canavalia gladiata TaxID=3824 RepID=A0AAN9QB46_CANGL